MSQQNQRLLSLWRILSRHYGVIITVAYAFAAIVGMAYYALLFDYFNLSVFDYWEAGDVLLAAFRQPLAMVFGILAVTLGMSLAYTDEYNAWLRSKGEWAWKLFGNYYAQRIGLRWKAGSVFITVFVAFWFLIIINSVAIGDGHDIWYAEIGHAEVVTEDGTLQGTVIASTNRYLVFLQSSDDKEAMRKTALALPVESIQAIRLCASRGGALHRLLQGAPCETDVEAKLEESESGESEAQKSEVEQAAKSSTSKN